MPNIDSEKVRKTLMLYMTTSVPDVAVGVEQRGQRGRAHQHDAVVGGEPVGQRGEAVRHPGVDGHVRQHARAVDEAGLRGDEQQRPLGEQRQDHDRRAPSGRCAVSRSARTAFIVLPVAGVMCQSR